MVIPCGGLATRLGKLTKNKPKSLIDIQGKPFLERQLELIKNYDFDELILCIGCLGDQIKQYFQDGKKFGISIKYSRDDGLGPIGAIKQAEPFLRPSFFMMYGDSYLPAVNFNEMYNRFGNQEKLALMAVWHNNNAIDTSNINVKHGAVISAGDFDSDYIDYGTTVMHKKALQYVPPNQPFSTESFWKLLSSKHELAAYEITERFYHIGNPERLNELRGLLGRTP